MWINFECDREFAVQVFAGGVNAISGESKLGSMSRAQSQIKAADSSQDYVVPPKQLWLDGIATADGKVMQFVADPVGSGYSVEAQLTGADTVAGLQFEIIPTERIPQILVKMLTGETVTFDVRLPCLVDDIKRMIEELSGIPVDRQRLIFSGKALEG